jgi:hypothetical protein
MTISKRLKITTLKAYSLDTQERLWTWGRVHTKFWQPPQPYLNQGGQIMPTLFCCPHQVLKATGAPDYRIGQWTLLPSNAFCLA